MISFKGKTTGYFLSYISFILSGCLIFTPLHKSENIIISLITAFITAVLTLYIILKINSTSLNKKKSLSILLPLFSCLFSVFTSLMMITEIIKDVAFVANRGVSLFYYIFLSFAILTVSYYLSVNTEKGIFRFSILAFIPFLFLFLSIFSSFITTKSAVFDFFTNDNTSYFQAIKQGAFTGVFFVIDSGVYFYCFRKFFSFIDEPSLKRVFFTGFVISFFLITIYNITTFSVFGKNLTKTLPDPDYALIKLIPGIDLTETISALRIISFMIKSSVYIFSSSSALNELLGNSKKSLTLIILTLHILIPITVIILTIFDKSLGYGAFQHLIYPVIILLSILISIINLMSKKN